MNRRTLLKGGIVIAATSQTPLAVAEVKPDRKDAIRECLYRLHALILEETGEDWIVMAAGNGVICLDVSRGLHDPRGRFGPKMVHGKLVEVKA